MAGLRFSQLPAQAERAAAEMAILIGKIRSRDQAESIVRAASTVIYWVAATILVIVAINAAKSGLGLLYLDDSLFWSHKWGPFQTEAVVDYLTFVSLRFAREGWAYILYFPLSFILRRYHSRIAAALFTLIGLGAVSILLVGVILALNYGSGPEMPPTLVLIILLHAVLLWFAARALVATVLLGHNKLKTELELYSHAAKNDLAAWDAVKFPAEGKSNPGAAGD
jgi:hypothetical protein